MNRNRDFPLSQKPVEEGVSNALREDIQIKKETEKNTEWHHTTYTHYIYDILVAKIKIETIRDDTQGPIYHVLEFSTINFQGDTKTTDLYSFIGVQKKYKESEKLLENAIGKTHIPQLGSMVFEDIIANIRLKGDKFIELQIALTSRGFYQKICDRLQKRELISKFTLTKKGWLCIELNTRQFSSNSLSEKVNKISRKNYK